MVLVEKSIIRALTYVEGMSNDFFAFITLIAFLAVSIIIITVISLLSARRVRKLRQRREQSQLRWAQYNYDLARHQSYNNSVQFQVQPPSVEPLDQIIARMIEEKLREERGVQLLQGSELKQKKALDNKGKGDKGETRVYHYLQSTFTNLKISPYILNPCNIVK